MPTVNLGRIKPIHRGEYSGAAAYKPLDLVNYNGAVYLCTSNTTGNLPTNPTFWSPLFDPNNAAAPDFIDALTAAVKFAIDQAALANYGVKALRQQAQQEGELTIQNRGVVSGCTVSKSLTATRNLSIAAGMAFAAGRRWPIAAVDNAASVPSNTTGASVTVYAYLLRDANQAYQLAVTAIGEAVPAAGIKIYNITIPAGNTDGTDPNLASVTLTDVRRLEPQFPVLLDNPASASAVLNTLYANDYRLTFDVISATGAPCESKCLQVSSRATNGFTVLLASAADDVTVRWRASKLNN